MTPGLENRTPNEEKYHDLLGHFFAEQIYDRDEEIITDTNAAIVFNDLPGDRVPMVAKIYEGWLKPRQCVPFKPDKVLQVGKSIGGYGENGTWSEEFQTDMNFLQNSKGLNPHNM